MTKQMETYELTYRLHSGETKKMKISTIYGPCRAAEAFRRKLQNKNVTFIRIDKVEQH